MDKIKCNQCQWQANITEFTGDGETNIGIIYARANIVHLTEHPDCVVAQKDWQRRANEEETK